MSRVGPGFRLKNLYANCVMVVTEDFCGYYNIFYFSATTMVVWTLHKVTYKNIAYLVAIYSEFDKFLSGQIGH